MAIFHYTIKIVGRSKGKSVISASAYLNGDVMKNEETGRISYYTSKKEVVYTSLMMCENAPPEWQIVPEENIKRFQKSVRYKRSEDKEAALEKFKITFQKQRLWNEVLKIEKSADAQLGRSFEFALPKEWSRQEQIQYTADYIKKTFVDKGMCADWSIHDKGDGNPHVHLLLTMRPFNPDHSWGKKEVKDWDFVRDKSGNIVIDESHPNWWQDKKNPDRHGIRIPVLDENGIQKIGARNRLQWKRVLTDATGWNNPKNCELWRSEWAKVCNEHLPLHNQVDHRSYEKQGKLQIPTIHEGADARKIEQKFLAGQKIKGSWKVAENQIIKQQNTLLQKCFPLCLFSFSTPITLSNATRIAPRFALPQSYPPFAYRKAYASLLCSYRGRSSRQKITLVQAHRNFCLVTLLALKKSPQRTLCSSRRRALSRVTTSLRLYLTVQTSSGP